MAKPLVYITYGMPKSGSTLAFNLTRAVLEDAGVTQTPVEAVAPGVFNFVEVIRPVELSALYDAARKAPKRPVAVKTHSGLWGCVERALAEGRVMAQANCRDPREIALSMIDAGRENRAWGKRNGEVIATPRDALPAVQAHVGKFAKWAAQPGVLTLNYDLVAFDTERAAGRIAAHLGLDVDVAACARAALAHGNLRNKAIRARWRDEMSARDAALYAETFADFIARHVASSS